VPLLAGRTDQHRDTVYAEMGCDRMIRDGRYKLMWGDPLRDTRRLGRLHLNKPVNIRPSPPRLYDLQTDPHELHDLVDDPNHTAVMRDMLAKLATRMVQHVQPRSNKTRGPYRPL
jgi:arylsulfatase A-like enzyme